jgi:glucose/arabinose dehydrogenase
VARTFALQTLSLSLLAGTLIGCPPAGPDDDDDAVGDPCEGVETTSGTDVDLEVVTSEVDLPTWIGAANDGSGRLFVAEQHGKIRRVRDDGTTRTYLDIEDSVIPFSGYEERGLLGVAFHPDFAENGHLFVSYIASGAQSGESRVARYTVSGDPASDEPDPASEEILLTLTQPAFNHNGGGIKFGPDGFLYIGFGDGGQGGDAFGNGQNPDTFMAKILRIDVDSGDPYGIPSDNPFLGDGNHRDETWAWGLRNPWRFSFDRETGDLYIADVGQDQVEEIDIGVSGANYGWSEVEGDRCFTNGCDQSAFEAPIYTYRRNGSTTVTGSSITGGYVYRGCAMPDLHGIYFFSDYPFGGDVPLATIEWSPGGPAADGPVHIESLGFAVSSFGEDEQGELYVADHQGGRILKIVAE